MGTVYLLHLDPPVGHARHYMGYADDLGRRLAAHEAGRGARLTQVAKARGCTLTLVRTWRGDRRLERRLKNRKEAPCLCPLCNPSANLSLPSPPRAAPTLELPEMPAYDPFAD